MDLDKLKILYNNFNELDGLKIYNDLEKLFGFPKENIGINLNDFYLKKVMFYYGNLEEINDMDKLKNLVKVYGNVYFEKFKEVSFLENLEEIDGNAYFNSLENASGLKNLKLVSGTIYFGNLDKACGLEKLKFVGKDIYFEYLKDAHGLESLEFIGRDAHFENLEEGYGLKSLKEIGRNAYFDHLLRGLKIQKIGNKAYFYNLDSLDDLKMSFDENVPIIYLGKKLDLPSNIPSLKVMVWDKESNRFKNY